MKRERQISTPVLWHIFSLSFLPLSGNIGLHVGHTPNPKLLNFMGPIQHFLERPLVSAYFKETMDKCTITNQRDFNILTSKSTPYTLQHDENI